MGESNRTGRQQTGDADGQAAGYEAAEAQRVVERKSDLFISHMLPSTSMTPSRQVSVCVCV